MRVPVLHIQGIDLESSMLPQFGNMVIVAMRRGVGHARYPPRPRIGRLQTLVHTICCHAAMGDAERELPWLPHVVYETQGGRPTGGPQFSRENI